MNKGLEALDYVKKSYCWRCVGICKDCSITTIKKELQAVEIIRTHILDNENYLKLVVDNTSITAEEYKLLQEVLL